MSGRDSLVEVTELVNYTFYTDYISLDIAKKEVPVSPLLIANAEMGKTSLVAQFCPASGLLELNDTTAYGLQHNYLDKLKSGTIKRIFIPDLINPTSRKQETVDSLITFFNSYISWEGVTAIATYAMQIIDLKDPLRGSIVATVTPQDFRRIFKDIAAVGFLSRLLPITYFYNKNTIDDIFDGIFEQNDGWGKIKLDLPTEKSTVELNPALAKQLKETSIAIGKQAGVFGFRAARALMTLCRAKALSENRKSVNKDDVERIIYLANRFIRFPPELLDLTYKGGRNV